MLQTLMALAFHDSGNSLISIFLYLHHLPIPVFIYLFKIARVDCFILLRIAIPQRKARREGSKENWEYVGPLKKKVFRMGLGG